MNPLRNVSEAELLGRTEGQVEALRARSCTPEEKGRLEVLELEAEAVKRGWTTSTYELPEG